jgi:hypothetical protein
MARGHQLQPVVLSEAERDHLESFSRRRTSAQAIACRARIVAHTRAPSRSSARSAATSTVGTTIRVPSSGPRRPTTSSLPSAVSAPESLTQDTSRSRYQPRSSKRAVSRLAQAARQDPLVARTARRTGCATLFMTQNAERRMRKEVRRLERSTSAKGCDQRHPGRLASAKAGSGGPCSCAIARRRKRPRRTPC